MPVIITCEIQDNSDPSLTGPDEWLGLREDPERSSSCGGSDNLILYRSGIFKIPRPAPPRLSWVWWITGPGELLRLRFWWSLLSCQTLVEDWQIEFTYTPTSLAATHSLNTLLYCTHWFSYKSLANCMTLYMWARRPADSGLDVSSADVSAAA